MRGAIQIGGAGEKGGTYSTSAEPRMFLTPDEAEQGQMKTKEISR